MLSGTILYREQKNKNKNIIREDMMGRLRFYFGRKTKFIRTGESI